MTTTTTSQNGGFVQYPDRVTKRTWYRATDRHTERATLKAGYVIKAHTFLESIQGGADAGKLIPHKGKYQGSLVNFAALTSGQTLILGGLTFTTGSAGISASQLALAFTGLVDGIGYAAATAAFTSAYGSATTTLGSFTSGTFTGFNTYNYYTQNPDYLENYQPADGNVDSATGVFTSTPIVTAVDFRVTSYLTNTALTATGTGTAPTIYTSAIASTVTPIAGISVYSVDATSADTEIPIYTEASFWADALTWAVNPLTDYILDSSGNQIAVSAYNTGVYGPDQFTTRRLMKQFVEQTNFKDIGFVLAGDVTGGTTYYV